MILARRQFVRGLAPTILLTRLAQAKPALDGRLRNRLELWANFASKTRTLIARYVVVRESALLYEPLSNGGTLAFLAPDRLVLRDDGTSGSMTLIEPMRVEIRSLAPISAPGWPAVSQGRNAATDWLGTRLLALFGAPDPDLLLRDSRPHVPRGRGYRLELLPPRNSSIRKTLRGLTIRLDPVQGAILELVIAQAQGDRIRFEFGDLRQNVSASELEGYFRVDT
jgi:hypothetical protein